MKKSCQDLEKNLGKIFSRSCKNLARNQAIQDFRMDLEQESCKIRKILASSKSWHGFGTDFLPTCQILKRLGKILQDIFDRGMLSCIVMLHVFYNNIHNVWAYAIKPCKVKNKDNVLPAWHFT